MVPWTCVSLGPGDMLVSSTVLAQLMVVPNTLLNRHTDDACYNCYMWHL